MGEKSRWSKRIETHFSVTTPGRTAGKKSHLQLSGRGDRVRLSLARNLIVNSEAAFSVNAPYQSVFALNRALLILLEF